ncbi:lacy proton/sugar symporter [Trichococcus palustris]|uniref:Lacy proton/sugar symporter n=1 Tax=Trichococcus palustris TaxID=140314 RepID=A0A143YLU2_9LACT|nr:MFS transporter [Trichococcus palustris]CZQ90444.1 lacy proton/sugar symporter [Trichococcus palustris]SFL11710.1 MFS transporter, PPP family, 3-phenylpropionic acid transporter [Trichococcus palustris]
MEYFRDKLYWKYVALFIFYFLAMAALSSLISVYLTGIGKSGSEISLILIVASIIAIGIQGLVGITNERWSIRTNITIYLLVGAAIALLFFVTTDTWLLGFVYGLSNAIILGVNPLFEGMATESHFRYGLIRLWGTLGYAAGQQVTGIIYDYIAPNSIFILFIVASLLAVVCIYILPKPKAATSPTGVIEISENPEKHTVKNIFKNKLFITYLVIAFLFFGPNMINTSYLPLLLKATGAPVSIVSVTLTVALFAEVLVMIFSNRFMDRFTNKQLLMAVLLLTAVNYLVCYLSSDFLVLSFIVITTKFFASGTFLMLHIKIVSTILNRKLITTGLTVVAMISRNIGTIFFQMIAGPVIDNLGLHMLYLILLIFTVIAMAIAIPFQIPPQPKEKLFS